MRRHHNKKTWSFELGKLRQVCEDRLKREMSERHIRELNDVDNHGIATTHFVPPKKAWDFGKDDYEPSQLTISFYGIN